MGAVSISCEPEDRSRVGTSADGSSCLPADLAIDPDAQHRSPDQSAVTDCRKCRDGSTLACSPGTPSVWTRRISRPASQDQMVQIGRASCREREKIVIVTKAA